jgi:hypothetical protein
MPHHRSRAQEISRRRQLNFHSHRLTRLKFSRQHRRDSTFAHV